MTLSGPHKGNSKDPAGQVDKAASKSTKINLYQMNSHTNLRKKLEIIADFSWTSLHVVLVILVQSSTLKLGISSGIFIYVQRSEHHERQIQ